MTEVDLLRDTETAHHDVFVLLLPTNKLALSRMGDAATLFSLIFFLRAAHNWFGATGPPPRMIVTRLHRMNGSSIKT